MVIARHWGWLTYAHVMPETLIWLMGEILCTLGIPQNWVVKDLRFWVYDIKHGDRFPFPIISQDLLEWTSWHREIVKAFFSLKCAAPNFYTTGGNLRIPT